VLPGTPYSGIGCAIQPLPSGRVDSPQHKGLNRFKELPVGDLRIDDTDRTTSVSVNLRVGRIPPFKYFRQNASRLEKTCLSPQPV